MITPIENVTIQYTTNVTPVTNNQLFFVIAEVDLDFDIAYYCTKAVTHQEDNSTMYMELGHSAFHYRGVPTLYTSLLAADSTVEYNRLKEAIVLPMLGREYNKLFVESAGVYRTLDNGKNVVRFFNLKQGSDLYLSVHMNYRGKD